MAKVDKYSIYGLKRRPTYAEIIGMLDDNEKITGKLPNRDATFFRNSPEGSIFDGSDAMEQLKEEQGKLLLRQMSEVLLRQNVRTAGRTYHTERNQRLPTTSPVISQPTQPMNVDEELTTREAGRSPQTTPTVSSSSTHQASQLNAEITQRANTATKRREETAMNHRGEVFKQSKPTITEQIHHINPPRSFTPIRPENYELTELEDEATSIKKGREKKVIKSKTAKTKREDIPTSSTQPLPTVEVMDVSSSSKREEPETRIEPKGKAGRPKMFKEGTERKNPEKRDGSSPEEEPKVRKKRNNKKTEMASGGVEADDENEEPTKGGKGVRKTIEKPVAPSSIGIQRLREEFVNANNKGIISKDEYERFNELYKDFISSKGNRGQKSKIISEMRVVYRNVLYQRLKDLFKTQ